MTTPDARKLAAALDLVATVGQVIRIKGTIPSGELYARLMGHVSLNDYNLMLETLKKAKLIKVSGHLITWTGPKGGDSAESAGNEPKQTGEDAGGAGQRGNDQGSEG